MKIRLLDNEMYDKQEVLDNMDDDKFYYGDLGKLALSSSTIKLLLNSPKKYYYITKYGQDETPNLRLGRLVHMALLEPDKFDDLIFVECATRSAKKYKDAVAEHGAFKVYTKKEFNDTDRIAQALMRNSKAQSLMNGDFEIPMIGSIQGYPFRGKADILNGGGIVDIKTTQDLSTFKYSSIKYGYQIQTYIYCELFNVPFYDMKFLCVDKNTLDIGIFDCTESFYEAGKIQVQKAIGIYEEFFKNKDWETTEITEALDEYYIQGVLDINPRNNE